MSPQPVHGRGSASNPPNRFIPIYYDPDPDCPPEEASSSATCFYRDTTRTIIATNDSPDVGFTHSVNPYRGCEHGCAYCFARPFHEYLGLSAGLDFETKIFVKEDAPELLRKELMAKSWKPTVIVFSGVTDCYQPAERFYKLTRRCLEVCAEFHNPVGVITKSALVARDADLLSALARDNAACVFMSVTTLDAHVAGAMEPRASRPAARLKAIEALSKAGVPVGVFAAPMIPGLTDHELPAILTAGKKAGASFGGYVMLRLPGAVAKLFPEWLERHFPERKEKVLGRVRRMRGGKLNETRFVARMRPKGAEIEALKALYQATVKKLGLREPPELSTAAFRRPGERSLFD